MNEIKNNLKKKWNERKAYKSSSWLQLLLKIILFIGVIILMKYLSFQDDEKGQNSIQESSNNLQVINTRLYL